MTRYLCWKAIVSHYSKCNLSVETDKLVAISGIAQRMKKLLGTEYLTGLWRSELEVQLLWEVDISSSPNSNRSSRYVAPTWSWASINGVRIKVPLSSAYSSRHRIFCSITDVQVTPPQSTTECTDGFISLRCFLIPINPNFDSEDIVVALFDGFQKPEHGEEVKIYLKKMIDAPMTNVDDFDFWCVPIHVLSAPLKVTEGLLFSHKDEPKIFRNQRGSFENVDLSMLHKRFQEVTRV